MSVKRMAVVENGIVVNVIVYDPQGTWLPQPDQTLIEHDRASIGWAYDGENFTDPNE